MRCSAEKQLKANASVIVVQHGVESHASLLYRQVALPLPLSFRLSLSLFLSLSLSLARSLSLYLSLSLSLSLSFSRSLSLSLFLVRTRSGFSRFLRAESCRTKTQMRAVKTEGVAVGQGPRLHAASLHRGCSGLHGDIGIWFAGRGRLHPAAGPEFTTFFASRSCGEVLPGSKRRGSLLSFPSSILLHEAAIGVHTGHTS